MDHLCRRLVIALLSIGAASACGGSSSTPSSTGLQIIGVGAAITGSSGNYSYSIDLQLRNGGAQALTIKSLQVVVSQSGNAFYNVTIGPSPATATITSNQQVGWTGINATHVPSPGDTMVLTVTYTGPDGVDRQITTSTHLG